MKYMGIDYHKQYFVATMMDEKGKVISKEKVSTDRDSIRSYFKRAGTEGDMGGLLRMGVFL